MSDFTLLTRYEYNIRRFTLWFQVFHPVQNTDLSSRTIKFLLYMPPDRTTPPYTYTLSDWTYYEYYIQPIGTISSDISSTSTPNLYEVTLIFGPDCLTGLSEYNPVTEEEEYKFELSCGFGYDDAYAEIDLSASPAYLNDDDPPEIMSESTFQVFPNIFFNGLTELRDIDDNPYTTISTKNYEILVENYKTSRMGDETEIPLLSANADWIETSASARCLYDNESVNFNDYGYLYNWFVIENPKFVKLFRGNVVQTGWLVPSDSDWNIIRDDFIESGYNWDETTTGNKIGKAMASAGEEWSTSATEGQVGNDQGSNNSSGFTGLPGGVRDVSGNFDKKEDEGNWWTSTDDNSDAQIRSLFYNDESFFGDESHTLDKKSGVSIRLVRRLQTNMVLITFNSQSGSDPFPSLLSVQIGEEYGELATTTRLGYTFDGWFTESSGGDQITETTIVIVDEDHTLYAQWEAISYTITYHLNGGVNHVGNPKNYTIESDTITLLDPSRTGYTFGGWYEDEGFETAITEIPEGSTGNKTVYAKWGFRVQFNSLGGSLVPDQIVLSGDKLNKPNDPTKIGYTFRYWYVKGSE